MKINTKQKIGLSYIGLILIVIVLILYIHNNKVSTEPQTKLQENTTSTEVKKEDYFVITDTKSNEKVATLTKGSLFYQDGDYFIYEVSGNSDIKTCDQFYAYNTKTKIKTLLVAEGNKYLENRPECERHIAGLFIIDEKVYLLTSDTSYWTPVRITYEIKLGNTIPVEKIGNLIDTHTDELTLTKYQNKYYFNSGNGDACIGWYSLYEINFTENKIKYTANSSNDCGEYQFILGFYGDKVIYASGLNYDKYSLEQNENALPSKIMSLYFSYINNPNATSSILSDKDFQNISNEYTEVIYDAGRENLIFFNENSHVAITYNLKQGVFGSKITYPLTYTTIGNTEKIEIKSPYITEMVLNNGYKVKLVRE